MQKRRNTIIRTVALVAIATLLVVLFFALRPELPCVHYDSRIVYDPTLGRNVVILGRCLEHGIPP